MQEEASSYGPRRICNTIIIIIGVNYNGIRCMNTIGEENAKYDKLRSAI